MSSGEEYWTYMSIEDRKKLLTIKNFWQGFDTYLWRYLPEMVKDFINDEFEKSDAKSSF